jgi:flagellar protein FlaG
LERALAQAAGLDPQEAQQVRVALSVDQTTNQVVARVVNKDTGELVRQVPTEQVIRNAVLVHEMLGATLNKQV